QKSIESQKSNNLPYYVIPLAPRKSNVDRYELMCLKSHLDFPLPCRTRTGKIITAHSIEQIWKRSTERLGLAKEGMGVHTLRSVFATECSRLSVSNAVIQSQLGHGDRGSAGGLGYVRPATETCYVELC